MKKTTIYKILLSVSILLCVLFFVFVFIDFSYYNETYSAPFCAYLLVRAFEFALPSIIILLVAIGIKGKKKK